MTAGFVVPSADVMADMADDQLAGLIHRLQEAVESCTNTIAVKEGRGINADGVRSARRHYERGLRAATAVERARNGIPVQFEPARPVHDFVSAFHTLKAVNRLLGLCQVEHDAVTALLADDEADDATTDRLWEAVQKAHDDVERALREGGEQAA